MPKQTRKRTPSIQSKKPPEVSRIYVVPKKDYNYILRSGKGEKDRFHFDDDERVEYVRSRGEGGKLVALVTLEAYEAHTSVLMNRSGKTPSFKTLQRIKKKNSRLERIVYQGIIDYCLPTAKEMRATIKRQLCIIDPNEFDVHGKRNIPDVQYKW